LFDFYHLGQTDPKKLNYILNYFEKIDSPLILSYLIPSYLTMSHNIKKRKLITDPKHDAISEIHDQLEQNQAEQNDLAEKMDDLIRSQFEYLFTVAVYKKNKADQNVLLGYCGLYYQYHEAQKVADAKIKEGLPTPLSTIKYLRVQIVNPKDLENMYCYIGKHIPLSIKILNNNNSINLRIC